MKIQHAAIMASMTGFILIGASLACTGAEEADLRARVQKEFPGALRALEDHFSGTTGSVSYVMEQGLPGVKGKARHMGTAGKFWFATKSPHFARVISNSMKPLASSKMKSEGEKVLKSSESSGPTLVYCINEDDSFSLLKKNSESEYMITAFEKNISGSPPYEFKVQMDGWLIEYVNAPFSLSAIYQPLSRIISKDGFSIQHIAEVRQQDETVLKLDVRLKEGTWKIADGTKPSPEYDGWIIVAPEKKWVVKAYEIGHGDSGLRGHVDYVDSQDGYPLPARVFVEAFDRQSGKPKFRHDFHFDDLRLVNPPDSEFRLTAFGLPELRPPEITPSRFANRGVFWLFGAAIVSLSIAVILKCQGRLLRRTPLGSAPNEVEHRSGSGEASPTH